MRDDVRIRPMNELDIDGIVRVDDRITGKDRPEPGTVVDYVPVYASPCGMAFAYWDDLSPE